MKKSLFFIFLIFSTIFVRADEGMWLPLFLKYNEAEMQQMGFKLTAEDVYSVNNHSMKDAIVLFGGGCTAELISPEGLLITNHHCGYSFVQSHSSLEHNYLHNGFWAKSYEEEIANPGLTVTFLIRMEEVTDKVFAGTSADMSESERENIIKKNIVRIQDDAVKGTSYSAVIKSFFYGNQYFMFVNQTYKDVRLVGVPPESIGKFGGDTDNWIWPRHTGDFSLYRIYTDPNGNPAEYSKDNIPLKSKKYFKISTAGVKENDFTLVFGFPGSTEQFLTSDGVDLVANVRNPIAIHQRGARLDIMKKNMDLSTEIRLMYSAKANSIANGWKKWIGENKGIVDCDVINMKIKEENEVLNWINADPVRKNKYDNILPEIKSFYKTYTPIIKKQTYFYETFYAIELFRFVYQNFIPLMKSCKSDNFSDNDFVESKLKLKEKSTNFYSQYYKPIDKEIFVELLYFYFNTLEPEYISEDLKRFINIPKENLATMANEIYENSPFADIVSLHKFIDKASKNSFLKLEKSLLFQLLIPAYEYYYANMNLMNSSEVHLDLLYRDYVKVIMEKDSDKTFYPDANLTMRVTYGKVQGFTPKDAVDYVYYTTLGGVIEKENPDIFDYRVEPKLKTLFETKDYGIYANEKGELPVAFIASNHTTGGNSGSPVINANGDLIGVNFDRVWEGTMSDIYYDVNRCRNISLDIRYFLFIVDKFADAQNIINELTIVK